MERASSKQSGAKDSSSTSGGGADQDKDINSHSNESEDEELLSESVGTISAPQTSPQGAKDSRGNRKKALGRYFTDRGYLDRMSRQERRRIEGEMIKGRKPALTVQNIVQELRQVDLNRLRFSPPVNVLGIPSTKLAELKAAHHSTDEQEAAVVRYWLLRDPLASWRRIIYQLDDWAAWSDCGHYSDIADRIRHYAEELTDTTLTHSNLSTVLNHVVGLDKLIYCLNILPSVKENIREHSKDEEQQQDECIYYWRNVSPYSIIGWGYLGGDLHYFRQEAALGAAKEYIQRAPDASLTVDDLSTVFDSVQDMDSFMESGWLQIPRSKWRELQQQYDSRQIKKPFAECFVTQHPAPSWRIVAFALWQKKELGALEVVQKLYLKGSSESRRLFEHSMKRGYVDMHSDKMLLYGSAGVGKTCTMKIVAGEKPPEVRNSTPVATRPVIMYQLQKVGGKWRKYVSQDRMKLCARISKTTLGREVIEALTKVKSEVEEADQQALDQESKMDKGSERRTSTAANCQQPASVSAQKSENPTPKPNASTVQLQSSVDPNVLKVIHDVLDEMFQLIDECPETEEPLSYIHKILVSDCGGQPQFHEVLPIFLRRMSLILFVFKLSEEFTNRPMIEYYEEGKALGTPYESDLTTEQLIKQGLQSLHSHRSNKDSSKDSEAPRIIMVGTHKDEESKCSESRETKNQKLREMLLPTFKKEIIYYQPGTNTVLFPMNAKCPGKEEEDMAQAIVSKFSTENRSDKRQLPLQWLGFEIMLEEITQRLERGILSRSECLEIAHRLHLDESALDAALIYLDELSLVFYYPEILPEVVFTNPQVLLDKISELVKVHHVKLHRFSGDDWQNFFCHALITVEFLQQKVFNKHYVSGLFEPKQLAILYQKLLIFADFSDGRFFVPSLLRMLSSKEVASHRLSLDSVIAPLVLHFPDGPPRRGIFCALVSFLTSPENHFPGPWELKMPTKSVTPTCLYRNCIQFTVAGFKTACTITLIDTLLHFEVHFKVKSQQAASKFCPIIRRAISVGLQKANLVLGYTNSTPSFALFCSCGEGDLHPATIGDGCWICSLDKGIGEELAPNQQLWLKEQNSAVDTVQSSLASKPGLHELDLITGNGKVVSVIDKVAYVWEKVATRLLFEGHDISRIRKDEHQAEGACRTVFVEWLQGKGRTPTTWETVIKALDEAQQGELAKDLREVLGIKTDHHEVDVHSDELQPSEHSGMDTSQTVSKSNRGKRDNNGHDKLSASTTQQEITVTSCGKEQLPKAFKLLLPLASEWENIGLCLGLIDFEDSVKASAKTAPSCLRETLKLWLNHVDPPPTWIELAEAVEPFNSDVAAKVKAL